MAKGNKNKATKNNAIKNNATKNKASGQANSKTSLEYETFTLADSQRVVTLPKAFVDRMKALLKEDFDQYLSSFNDSRVAGLRVNTNKISPEDFERISPFDLIPIPWTTDGYYVAADLRPAKHPYFHAGLYYLQEPSAMAPAVALAAQPGQFILDVCSAPGGKTLQLANAVGEGGLVVSNDISATRLMAVMRNIEQFGLKNVVVTATDIEVFGPQQGQFYDGVLLDAPCSGEGMFRKDASMVSHWQPDSSLQYQEIQKRLLKESNGVLKPGGHLVYSTCTFSPEENEAVIWSGLGLFDDWQLVPIVLDQKGTPLGLTRGVALEHHGELEATVRLYPHKLEGEGHYVAKVQKGRAQAQAHDQAQIIGRPAYDPANGEAPKELVTFMDQVLNDLSSTGVGDFRTTKRFRLHGEKVALDPVAVPDLKGVRVLRRGWYLGDLKKGGFEPAQSFAMGLEWSQIKKAINFSVDDPQVLRYLKCESLDLDLPNGWYVVCVDHFPLGWAKVAGGQFKNKYPASWRMM